MAVRGLTAAAGGALRCDRCSFPSGLVPTSAPQSSVSVLVSMLKLALTVAAIALPDCINPSLIGGELFVATRPHPRRGVAQFTLAAGIVTFVFGLAFALGLGDLILSFVPKPGATVKYSLITAAGVVMAAGGGLDLDQKEGPNGLQAGQ